MLKVRAPEEALRHLRVLVPVRTHVPVDLAGSLRSWAERAGVGCVVTPLPGDGGLSVHLVDADTDDVRVFVQVVRSAGYRVAFELTSSMDEGRAEKDPKKNKVKTGTSSLA